MLASAFALVSACAATDTKSWRDDRPEPPSGGGGGVSADTGGAWAGDADAGGDSAAGAGGADRWPEPSADDRARLGIDFGAELDVLANDALVRDEVVIEISLAAAHGTAVVQSNRNVAYTPHWHYAGEDSFRYRVLLGDVVIGEAAVALTIVPSEWLLVGPHAYEQQARALPAELALGLTASVWDVDAHGVLWGSGGEELSLQAAVWREIVTLERLGGKDESGFHHVSSTGRVAGFAGNSDHRQGVVRNADGALTFWTVPEVDWLSFYALEGSSTALGAARGVATFGDLQVHAVRVELGATPVISVVTVPATAVASEVHGADGQGRAVGWFESDAGKVQGFVSVGDAAEAVAPPGADFATASDLDAGWVVGSARAAGAAHPEGFVFDGEAYTTVRLKDALATEVLGLGPGRELTGRFRDAAGTSLGFVSRPVAPNPAVARYFQAPEPIDSGIEHACSHSVLGPFETLVPGRELGAGAAFWSGHTSYTVVMPVEATSVVWLVYRAYAAGKLTLFIDEDVSLRLYGEDGQRLAAGLMARTAQCASIGWLQQFALPAPGNYAVAIEAAGLSHVHMIAEKYWIYAGK